jgi:hypothetical protein
MELRGACRVESDSRVGSAGGGPQGIDPALRDRVMQQIPVVAAALDAAAAEPSGYSLDELREAADKLMRALGRVLIEIARQRSAP